MEILRRAQQAEPCKSPRKTRRMLFLIPVSMRKTCNLLYFVGMLFSTRNYVLLPLIERNPSAEFFKSELTHVIGLGTILHTSATVRNQYLSTSVLS